MAGEFKNGLLHGQGETIDAHKQYTSGNYVNGKLEGEGIRIISQMLVYTGEFKEDQIYGAGKFEFLPSISKEIKAGNFPE
jgi:hypothetical protein